MKKGKGYFWLSQFQVQLLVLILIRYYKVKCARRKKSVNETWLLNCARFKVFGITRQKPKHVGEKNDDTFSNSHKDKEK